MARTTIASHRTVIRLLLLLCLLLSGASGAARAACAVQERGSVPFTATGGRLLVPVAVNGIDGTFVLDTGAERSLVTPEAVRRLGLALDEWVGTTMRGVGGVVEHPNADPRSLAFGGIPLHRRTVTRDTSLTVGAMQGTADGLLGRDYLSLLDLEFDMAAHRLKLYDVRGCTGRFLPWSGDYAAVPVQMPMTSALVVPITLDGTNLRALLDTGATSTVVAAPGMFRLGLTPGFLARDPAGAAHGIGRQAPEMRQHTFTTLRIGPVVAHDPVIWVAPIHVVPIVDALLGADWLTAQQRVWISFATAQVFFVAK